MTDGNTIIAIRVIGSVLITLVALICATYLLINHVEVPGEWWGLGGVVVGGVIGAAASLPIKTKEPRQ